MTPKFDFKKTILVIEDDPSIREALAAALEFEGYTVRLAGDGYDGLVEARKLPLPSLILLDIMMPVMNGHQFLAEFRDDISISAIPVIVVSANANPQDFLGTKGFFRKPFQIDQLLDGIAQQLN